MVPYPDIPDTVFTRPEVIAFIEADRAAARSQGAGEAKRAVISRLYTVAADLAQRKHMNAVSHLEDNAGRTLGRNALAVANREVDDQLRLAAIELKSIIDLLTAPTIPQAAAPQAAEVRASLAKPSVAECIAQLDVWNGHLEAAIDRQAHEKLGQHANDEPAAGRDPLEQFP